MQQMLITQISLVIKLVICNKCFSSNLVIKLGIQQQCLIQISLVTSYSATSAYYSNFFGIAGQFATSAYGQIS
jgi:hypothetical protein